MGIYMAVMGMVMMVVFTNIKQKNSGIGPK